MPKTGLRNLVTWCIILALSVAFVAESRPLDTGGSEKLAAHASASAQQAVLARLVNALQSPVMAANRPQLSGADADAAPASPLDPFAGIVKQVEGTVTPNEPGSELAAAALLARLGMQDRAEALLDRLDKRITKGDVTADDSFRKAFDAVGFAVGATRAPGQGVLRDEDAQVILDTLGVPGRTLVAQARGDADALAQLEAGALAVLGFLVFLLAVAGIVMLGGLAALIVFALLAAMGRVHGAGRTAGQWSPVYAESFAVWMAAFLLLNRTPASIFRWMHDHGMPEPGTNVRLALGVAASVAAFGAGAWWATRRGLTWRTFRAGIGLARFRATDVLWGVVCYSMGLVFLVVGLLAAMVVSSLLGQEGIQASHPIQQIIESADPVGILLTYVVACVCAPIFEEIFFRGALYRNVRDMFGPGAALVAVLVASVATSVLFAAIHPQGFIFIPVLGGLAVAFCLMREWRGSINAGIVAHAINNFVMVTVNVVLLSMLA